ncbi:MAG TPA: hypothetical protein VKK31_16515 [Thermoanaerobaculia bacterium]|nr:hypothetical protein [Thermoanaerobaculia bacterium]
MEAVTEEKSKGVNQSVVVTSTITISIFEQQGNAFIGWFISPNYAIGPYDKIELRKGTTLIKEWPIKGYAGTLETDTAWAPDLDASYLALNQINPTGWRTLVATPNT